METQFKIIGVLLILLAGIHAVFPSYFNWKNELKQLSLVNKQVMVIHTFFIALIVFLMGVLCLCYSDLLLKSELGKIVCGGFAIFWSVRLFTQFFWYSSKLLIGKKFETGVHILFSGFWTYLAVVFTLAFFNHPQ